MGKIGARLPNFCLNRIRQHVRVRSPPQQIQSKLSDVDSAEKEDRKCGNYGTVGEDHPKKSDDDEVKPGLVIGRKIMIVVDSSSEAKGALLWSLSHTVQIQDKVILLHVIKPSKQASGEEECSKETAPRSYQVIQSFKNTCQLKRPEVQIEVSVVEGIEKGPTIVKEARKQGVGLLVLGQKKRSMTWRLVMMWAGNHQAATRGGVVEYCIQNADCMAVAVRRKNKKQGGYLITTKRHKDFWLLA